MKFWIKKENDADPDIEWNDAYILTLNRDSKSTIYSGLPNIWYHLGQQRMNSIYEDLFVIGLSVFALDKRISRSQHNVKTENARLSISLAAGDFILYKMLL